MSYCHPILLRSTCFISFDKDKEPEIWLVPVSFRDVEKREISQSHLGNKVVCESSLVTCLVWLTSFLQEWGHRAAWVCCLGLLFWLFWFSLSLEQTKKWCFYLVFWMGTARFREAVPWAWKVLLKWDTSSFYSIQLTGNLPNKQEVMYQNNSPLTQVDFVDYPKLLLASFCLQTNNLVWLEQQQEWAGLMDICVTALPPW